MLLSGSLLTDVLRGPTIQRLDVESRKAFADSALGEETMCSFRVTISGGAIVRFMFNEVPLFTMFENFFVGCWNYEARGNTK